MNIKDSGEKEEYYKFNFDLTEEEFNKLKLIGLREIKNDDVALVNYASTFLLKEGIKNMEENILLNGGSLPDDYFSSCECNQCCNSMDCNCECDCNSDIKYMDCNYSNCCDCCNNCISCSEENEEDEECGEKT